MPQVACLIPSGFELAYVIKTKLILQELWRCQTGWDEELPDEILWSWRG